MSLAMALMCSLRLFHIGSLLLLLFTIVWLQVILRRPFFTSLPIFSIYLFRNCCLCGGGLEIQNVSIHIHIMGVVRGDLVI